VLYVDSSALVKLVLVEPESAAMFGLFRADAGRLASALAQLELLRAVSRADPRTSCRERALDVLRTVSLMQIDGAVLDDAVKLGPPTLRSLDAIHLATALLVASDLDGFVTYDSRLAEAAGKLGLPVLSPGSE